MFLFWLLLALAIGTLENLKDSYDAYKHPYQTPDCFKPKPWEQEYINKNKYKYR